MQNVKINNNEFELISSIFSDDIKLFDIKLRLNKEVNHRTKETEERKSEHFAVSINHLRSKRKLINYLQIDSVESQATIKTVFGEKPSFCRELCKDCNIKCAYKLEDFTNIEKIGQVKIREELQRHGHPSTRIFKKKQRSTKESLKELIDHYKFKHF